MAGLPYGTAVEGGGGGTSDLCFCLDARCQRAGSKQSQPRGYETIEKSSDTSKRWAPIADRYGVKYGEIGVPIHGQKIHGYTTGVKKKSPYYKWSYLTPFITGVLGFTLQVLL